MWQVVMDAIRVLAVLLLTECGDVRIRGSNRRKCTLMHVSIVSEAEASVNV